MNIPLPGEEIPLPPPLPPDEKASKFAASSLSSDNQNRYLPSTAANQNVALGAVSANDEHEGKKSTGKGILSVKQAKKRLLAFSGRAPLPVKSLKVLPAEADEEVMEKKPAPSKKKQKVIEQIKCEEERIKEAFGLKNILFDPYAPGLGPLENVMLDPSKLLKYEKKGHTLSDMRNRVVEVSAAIEEFHNEVEKAERRKLRRSRHHSRESKRDESSRSRRKPKKLPSNWFQFKSEGFTFDAIHELQKGASSPLRAMSPPSDEGSLFARRDVLAETKSILTRYSILPSTPRLLRSVKVDGEKQEIRSSSVRFTKTKPSVSYSINPVVYRTWLATRRELQMYEPRENLELAEKIWNQNANFDHDSQLEKDDSGRGWFSSELVINQDSDDDSVNKDSCSMQASPVSELVPLPNSVTPVDEALDEDKVSSPHRLHVQSRWDSDIESSGDCDSKTKDNTDDANYEGLVDLKTGEKVPVVDDKEDKALSVAGKSFNEGLNEEYEAFLEILGDSIECHQNSQRCDDSTEKCIPLDSPTAPEVSMKKKEKKLQKKLKKEKRKQKKAKKIAMKHAKKLKKKGKSEKREKKHKCSSEDSSFPSDVHIKCSPDHGKEVEDLDKHEVILSDKLEIILSDQNSSEPIVDIEITDSGVNDGTVGTEGCNEEYTFSGSQCYETHDSDTFQLGENNDDCEAVEMSLSPGSSPDSLNSSSVVSPSTCPLPEDIPLPPPFKQIWQNVETTPSSVGEEEFDEEPLPPGMTPYLSSSDDWKAELSMYAKSIPTKLTPNSISPEAKEECISHSIVSTSDTSAEGTCSTPDISDFPLVKDTVGDLDQSLLPKKDGKTITFRLGSAKPAGSVKLLKKPLAGFSADDDAVEGPKLPMRDRLPNASAEIREKEKILNALKEISLPSEVKDHEDDSAGKENTSRSELPPSPKRSKHHKYSPSREGTGERTGKHSRRNRSPYVSPSPRRSQSPSPRRSRSPKKSHRKSKSSQSPDIGDGGSSPLRQDVHHDRSGSKKSQRFSTSPPPERRDNSSSKHDRSPDAKRRGVSRSSGGYRSPSRHSRRKSPEENQINKMYSRKNHLERPYERERRGSPLRRALKGSQSPDSRHPGSSRRHSSRTDCHGDYDYNNGYTELSEYQMPSKCRQEKQELEPVNFDRGSPVAQHKSKEAPDVEELHGSKVNIKLPELTQKSYSTANSPKHVTSTERPMMEHQIYSDDHSSSLIWDAYSDSDYPGHPEAYHHSSGGKSQSRVIQVGNMLQILPQELSPEQVADTHAPELSHDQPEHSFSSSFHQEPLYHEKQPGVQHSNVIEVVISKSSSVNEIDKSEGAKTEQTWSTTDTSSKISSASGLTISNVLDISLPPPNVLPLSTSGPPVVMPSLSVPPPPLPAHLIKSSLPPTTPVMTSAPPLPTTPVMQATVVTAAPPPPTTHVLHSSVMTAAPPLPTTPVLHSSIMTSAPPLLASPVMQASVMTTAPPFPTTPVMQASVMTAAPPLPTIPVMQASVMTAAPPLPTTPVVQPSVMTTAPPLPTTPLVQPSVMTTAPPFPTTPVMQPSVLAAAPSSSTSIPPPVPTTSFLCQNLPPLPKTYSSVPLNVPPPLPSLPPSLTSGASQTIPSSSVTESISAPPVEPTSQNISGSVSVNAPEPSNLDMALGQAVSVPTSLDIAFGSFCQSTLTAAAAAAVAAGVSLPVVQILSILQQQQDYFKRAEGEIVPEVASEVQKAELERQEHKERRRRERKARHLARKAKALQQNHVPNDGSDADDEATLLQEAISESPVIGSPVPDYELVGDDSDEDDDTFRKKSVQPIPSLPPPSKGILLSPTYRHHGNHEAKSVTFADGILPGEGTSPSGGEEIHSPPPPSEVKKKKVTSKKPKKRSVKVKLIKQYKLEECEDESPPPPPPPDPPVTALQLYPGCTHYTYTSPGLVVVYTRQPNLVYSQ